MKATFLSATFAGLLVIFASDAIAQTTRAEFAQKIAIAQGLTELFDQQLAQQREVAREHAANLFDQAIAAGGGQANPKQRAALDRFVVRVGETFSGKEIADNWVAQYGKELSLQELQGILSYYESAIGRKDIAATKLAMPAFSSWMAQESQIRTASLIQAFVADLQAAGH